MSQDMEYYISTRQWTEASNPPTDQQLKALVVAVQDNLKVEGGVTGLGKRLGKKHRFNLMMRLAGALLIVAIGILPGRVIVVGETQVVCMEFAVRP